MCFLVTGSQNQLRKISMVDFGGLTGQFLGKIKHDWSEFRI